MKYKTKAFRILFCVFLLSNTFKIYAQESSFFKKTRWSLTHLISLGPTHSWFIASLNNERNKYSNNSEILELYKIRKGIFMIHEFQCGYRSLNWLENQIFINLCCNFLTTGSQPYDSTVPEFKRKKFTGSLDFNLGTNALFYQNNFFELIGLGLKTSLPFNYGKYYQFIPILKLGFGYKFEFGLILRFATNLSLCMVGLKDKYDEILKEISTKSDSRDKKIAEFGSNISHNTLEFSIGFDYGVLFNKKNNQ